MHRRSLLLAVAAGLASILIPASAHAALYSPALPGDALYVANSNTGNSIVKFTPGGTGSVFASSGLNAPHGLAFDSASNLYVANANNSTIEKFTPGGVGSVFASSGLNVPDSLAFDSAGNLYASNFDGSTIEKFTPGGVGSLFASTSRPAGLAFDRAGNLYAANYSSNTIEEFSALGADLGVFASSGMHNPIGLAFGPVPEPATLAVGLLCLGVGMARRRRSAARE